MNCQQMITFIEKRNHINLPAVTWQDLFRVAWGGIFGKNSSTILNI